MKKLLLFLSLFVILTKMNAQQWQPITIQGYENAIFTSSCFINANEGWLFIEPQSFDNLELLHTSDGAQTFERILVLPYDYKCYKIQMLDSLYGYAKIDNSPAHENYFWKTSDGGKHWQDITDTALFNYGNPLWSQRNFCFVNRNLGFFGGNSAIYKTENGGINWIKTNTPTMIDSNTSIFFRVNSIYFTDEKYGWAACSLFIDAGIGMKTTDGGQNWSICTPITGDFYKVHFADSLIGGMVGSGSFSSQVIGTQNNFDSLSYAYYGTWPQWATSICYQNDSTIWVSGVPPVIYRSIDQGHTFKAYDTTFAASYENISIGEIQFFGHTGYAYSFISLLKLVDTLTTEVKESISSEYEILISPNPTSDKCEISVSIPRSENSVLEIYSSNGALVQKKEYELKAGMNQFYLELRTFKPGIYFLKFNFPLIQITRKIIKQ